MTVRLERPLTVAIDGPAGAGKSTVARAVARALGYTYIDSGAMYRAATLNVLRRGVDLNAPEAVSAVVAQSEIALRAGPDGPRVYLDGEDVTEAIRSVEVGEAVAKVAQIPAVRETLVALQRRMGQRGGVVMDGRDIGTVVLPWADVKVFLTASSKERARRRYEELKAAGKSVTFAEVYDALTRRDAMDASRAHSPLRQAPDAVAIDTTGRSIEDVIAEVLALCYQRGGAPCSM